MEQDNLVHYAYQKILAAGELLGQACAAQSFGEQGLIETALATEEVTRLMREFRREARQVLKLVDRFLRHEG